MIGSFLERSQTERRYELFFGNAASVVTHRKRENLILKRGSDHDRVAFRMSQTVMQCFPEKQQKMAVGLPR